MSDQMIISVTDGLVPENNATIDKGSMVGTSYTKEQTQALLKTSFAGSLKIEDKPEPKSPVWYFASEIGTYVNAGNVTTLPNQINVLNYNGVSWGLSSVPMTNSKNIIVFEDFKNAVYASSPVVSIGDSVWLQFEGASSDIATVKLPIKTGEQAFVFTKQGAFSPCFITDHNNVVKQKFGDPHVNYLNNPLEVTSNYDGYLIVNAHEFSNLERANIRVYRGDVYKYEKINETVQEPSVEVINKTVKKGGTVGVDCDFTDIKVAINSITDNSERKRYVLNVLDGDYDYSNDGDAYGILLKNYITLKGQSFNTRIIKRQPSFSWGQNAVEKAPGDFDYIVMQGFTVISNNCKAPIHVDSESVKYALFENLNLINEQALGTGDNPADGEANCFALGWRMNDHVVLRNIKANGKLWGHNATDTKSSGTFEFINCNCRVIQIGDLTSQGNDNIIVKGCEVDEFQLLWFSEFNSGYPKRNSFSFAFEGNNIASAVVKDHAGTHDALEEFYKGKYPFSISGLHKEMNGIGITKGSNVTKINNSTVKTWQTGEVVFGKAIENTDINNRLLIQLQR